MDEPLEISPALHPIRARIRPPGSKSITNRALVCAALADGISTLAGALDSEDTQVMIDGLHRLGIKVERHAHTSSDVVSTPQSISPPPLPAALTIHGTCGQIPAFEAELYCANSGTTIRFLTALATLGHGAFRLDGNPRMRERPIADLLHALNQLGAHATSEYGNGCPPVVVHANGLPGGTATIRGDISSQFLSAVLMAAPAARSPIVLHIDGPLVSLPYVRMTLSVMHAFGAHVETSPQLNHFHIAPQHYRVCHYEIEPDASAASYFWAAAAVTGGEVTVEGLSASSLQGDVAFVDCLERMGCQARRESNSITIIGQPLKGIEVDMNAISDTVQTLAVTALFAEGPTIIRNVAHIRHKETDRIAALAAELRKLGATVQQRDDGLTIIPGPPRPASIDTYNDHRMAMSFAIAGLRIPGVRIENPRCVEKTYPAFFADLALIRGQAS